MVEFKTKLKNGQLIVKAKIASNKEINEWEMNMFCQKNIRGLMNMNQFKSRFVEYIGPEGVPLAEYMQRPLSKNEFFHIVSQIVEMTKNVESNQLLMKNVVVDLNYIFINEYTREVHFIYLPLTSNYLCMDAVSLIKSIVYMARFEESNGTEYVSEFIACLNEADMSAVELIGQHIYGRTNQTAQPVRRQTTGQSGFMTDKPAEYYQHYANKGNPMAMSNEGEDQTTVLNSEVTQFITEEEETGLLQPDGYGQEIPNPAYLLRQSTNERIILNKPVFRIGKERSYVDYFVSNNNMVSRSHADIITRGNRYFVYDHNSKNKTYVNEVMIPVQVESEIFSGSILRLANEVFEFHVD